MKIKGQGAVIRAGKAVISSIKTCYEALCFHPVIVFLLLFFSALHKFCPSLSGFLISSSPVIICTTLLLGTLLSYGEPNFPEIEEEEEEKKTSHDVPAAEVSRSADDLFIKKGNSIFGQNHVEHGGDVYEDAAADPSYKVTASHDVIVAQKDERSYRERNLYQWTNETATETTSDKGVNFSETNGNWEKNTVPTDHDLEEKKESNEVGTSSTVETEKLDVLREEDMTEEWDDSNEELYEKPHFHGNNVEEGTSHANDCVECGAGLFGDCGVNIGGVKVELYESKPHTGFYSLLSSSKRKSDEFGDYSDSYSEGEESSPGASRSDFAPMLDELHPLLDSEPSHPADVQIGELDDASQTYSTEQISDDGSEEEVFDDASEEDHEYNELPKGEDDNKEVMMPWTADDAKNVMDIGTSELERNQRLENLVAKRKAKKMAEVGNLINLDHNESMSLMNKFSNLRISPVSTERRNPFDNLNDSDEAKNLPPIPGSAPPTLLRGRNPFEFPFNQDDATSADGSLQYFMHPQQRLQIQYLLRVLEELPMKGPYYGDKEEKKLDTTLPPFFVSKESIEEKLGHDQYERQLSEASDSKLSYIVENESVSSVTDREDEHIVEHISEQEDELVSPKHNEPTIVEFEVEEREIHLGSCYESVHNSSDAKDVHKDVASATLQVREIRCEELPISYGPLNASDKKNSPSGNENLHRSAGGHSPSAESNFDSLMLSKGNSAAEISDLSSVPRSSELEQLRRDENLLIDEKSVLKGLSFAEKDETSTVQESRCKKSSPIDDAMDQWEDAEDEEGMRHAVNARDVDDLVSPSAFSQDDGFIGICMTKPITDSDPFTFQEDDSDIPKIDNIENLNNSEMRISEVFVEPHKAVDKFMVLTENGEKQTLPDDVSMASSHSGDNSSNFTNMNEKAKVASSSPLMLSVNARSPEDIHSIFEKLDDGADTPTILNLGIGDNSSNATSMNEKEKIASSSSLMLSINAKSHEDIYSIFEKLDDGAGTPTILNLGLGSPTAPEVGSSEENASTESFDIHAEMPHVEARTLDDLHMIKHLSGTGVDIPSCISEYNRSASVAALDELQWNKNVLQELPRCPSQLFRSTDTGVLSESSRLSTDAHESNAQALESQNLNPEQEAIKADEELLWNKNILRELPRCPSQLFQSTERETLISESTKMTTYPREFDDELFWNHTTRHELPRCPSQLFRSGADEAISKLTKIRAGPSDFKPQSTENQNIISNQEPERIGEELQRTMSIRQELACSPRQLSRSLSSETLPKDPVTEYEELHSIVNEISRQPSQLFRSASGETVLHLTNMYPEAQSPEDQNFASKKQESGNTSTNNDKQLNKDNEQVQRFSTDTPNEGNKEEPHETEINGELKEIEASCVEDIAIGVKLHTGVSVGNDAEEPTQETHSGHETEAPIIEEIPITSNQLSLENNDSQSSLLFGDASSKVESSEKHEKPIMDSNQPSDRNVDIQNEAARNPEDDIEFKDVSGSIPEPDLEQFETQDAFLSPKVNRNDIFGGQENLAEFDGTAGVFSGLKRDMELKDEEKTTSLARAESSDNVTFFDFDEDINGKAAEAEKPNER